ncbi:hypothetical protein BEN47_02555 [Hymenobacter lapidarius]|uniref:UspA domain-containing protein n=1 Tax=Hymenobacter lapidarius TaxID=1908237 RepID=A0A1G1T2Y1_9BACT|nr:universal stress protein [Hymenobacter lapidarius]OGX85219.1 hypothetical protein BEN47_02555 [Hymenobacter lapidarius]
MGRAGYVRKASAGVSSPAGPRNSADRCGSCCPRPRRGALYGDADHDPAAVVLRAVAEEQPDLLILIARPRSFLGRLFHRSVTAQVLLLPANAPNQPDYMPPMS